MEQYTLENPQKTFVNKPTKLVDIRPRFSFIKKFQRWLQVASIFAIFAIPGDGNLKNIQSASHIQSEIFPKNNALEKAKLYLETYSTPYFDSEDTNKNGINDYFEPRPDILQAEKQGSTYQGEIYSVTVTSKNKKGQPDLQTKNVRLRRDVGLTFYFVEKRDTRLGIIQKLSQIPEFAYLQDQTNKKQSFNIPDNQFPAGEWIPIPIANNNRTLPDEHFSAFCYVAIEDMKKHPLYGQDMEKLLQQKGVTQDSLVATMLAIAKQEAGGLPLGKFEFHRYEPGHWCFSYSYFHILMKACGLRAWKNLNMTIGQTYHPVNAAQWFLAFIFEKSKELRKDVSSFLPIEEHWDEFAAFYNGAQHEQNNYIASLYQFYKKARSSLRNFTDTEFLELIVPSGIKYFTIGNNDLSSILSESNTLNSKFFGKNILQIDENIDLVKQAILNYLQKTYKSKKVFSDDKVSVQYDDVKGALVVFQEGEEGRKTRKVKKGGESSVIEKEFVVSELIAKKQEKNKGKEPKNPR